MPDIPLVPPSSEKKPADRTNEAATISPEVVDGPRTPKFTFNPADHAEKIDKPRTPEEEASAQKKATIEGVALHHYMRIQAREMATRRGDKPFEDPKEEQNYQELVKNSKQIHQYFISNTEQARIANDVFMSKAEENKLQEIIKATEGKTDEKSLEDRKKAEEDLTKLQERVASLKKQLGDESAVEFEKLLGGNLTPEQIENAYQNVLIEAARKEKSKQLLQNEMDNSAQGLENAEQASKEADKRKQDQERKEKEWNDEKEQQMLKAIILVKQIQAEIESLKKNGDMTNPEELGKLNELVDDLGHLNKWMQDNGLDVLENSVETLTKNLEGLESLQTQLIEVNQKIENVTKAIEAGDNTKEQELEELKKVKETINESISQYLTEAGSKRANNLISALKHGIKEESKRKAFLDKIRKENQNQPPQESISSISPENPQTGSSKTGEFYDENLTSSTALESSLSSFSSLASPEAKSNLESSSKRFLSRYLSFIKWE